MRYFLRQTTLKVLSDPSRKQFSGSTPLYIFEDDVVITEKGISIGGDPLIEIEFTIKNQVENDEKKHSDF